MAVRGIPTTWVAEVLNDWVARRWDELHQSMNYYGSIAGRRYLLKVAVSASDDEIFTVHFDSEATRRYRQSRVFFDEVRDDPQD
jgi:hypothetical protein